MDNKITAIKSNLFSLLSQYSMSVKSENPFRMKTIFDDIAKTVDELIIASKEEGVHTGISMCNVCDEIEKFDKSL